jgi:uncharacterized membrane protein
MTALFAYLFDRDGEKKPEPPALVALFRPSRDTAKVFTYALMHLTVAILVAFAITRDIRTALAIGLIEPAAQTVAYYFHERAWNRRQQRQEREAAEG